MDFRKVLIILAVVLIAAFMACGEGEPEVQVDVVEETAETASDADNAVEAIDPGMQMTDEEKMAYVMENCICPQCPSWIPEAAEKGEGGYCATGVSECIVLEAGCVCPECPVTTEMGLQWGYYCTRGSAAELRAATE